MATYLNTNGSSETFDLTERYIYGSSRVGVYKEPVSMLAPPSAPAFNYLRPGYRQYELSNHLGNVTTTITAQKVPLYSGTTITGFAPQIVKSFDYSPFGVTRLDFDVTARLSGTFAVNDGVRYGFNGAERDDEVKGSGNSLNYGARILDPRLGRWLSIDPLAASYPGYSPYNFALNTPIQAKDPDGNVVLFVNGYYGTPTFACCGGTQKHWGSSWVNDVKAQIGDYNARYYDGSVDDRGFGGFAGRNNFDPNFRYKMGYMQGTTDAKDIVDNLEKGETIKIVTSSMGTAYARGLSQSITDYTTTLNKEIDAYNSGLEKNENGSYKDPSQVRDRVEAKIEYVIDLDSFQANQADPNAENSYYMKGDGIESKMLGTKDIQGAKKVGTMEGHHPSFADPSNFPKSNGNGSGSSDIENPSKNQ